MAGPSSSIEEQDSTASPFGPGVPALPEDATPEQKDAHWFKHVYQGDQMPQLTVRAVVVGGVLGMLMAAANLYTTLAIGWAFGVAITACVMSFVFWNLLRTVSGGKVSQMSILENNCMQSTASAAGYSTGSTIATMFGALLLLAEVPDGKTPADVKSWALPTSPIWAVALFTLCTGLMGVFLAIPLKRQMINHEQLRFPSGVAAAETLRSLYSKGRDAIDKAYTLVGGMIVGALVGILNTGEGTIHALDRLMGKVRLPELLPATGLFQIHGKQLTTFGFEPSMLLIAAGIITRMRVCLSMIAGSALLYFVVTPYLVAKDVATKGSGWVTDAAGVVTYDAGTIDPSVHANMMLNGSGSVIRLTTWSLWGGTALMVIASLTAVALQWKTIVRAFSSIGGGGPEVDARQKDIEVPFIWMVVGMVPITIAMLFVQVIAFKIAWWAGLIAVAMSFVLSLVACRATGETDTTPIGAMGKVMQLTFAIFHPGQMVPNLASAGIAANSASSSADLLTDLKSGYLLGANPRRQFIAQFIGVFFGTIAIVPIWFLMVPNKAALEKFAAPATRQWEAVARVLTKGVETLPESAKLAILIGAAVGIILPLIDKFSPARLRPYLPSAMGLGLSWVVPFNNALGFFLGALVIFGWELINRKGADKYSVPLASGLIAGESLIKAVIAMTATALGLLGMQ
jgi:OPT family oligopeptide transporter